MRTIAITYEKGGVGKTATAVNLAGILASRGKRVLLVDTDPQAYATTYYGRFDPKQPGVYGAMRGSCQTEDAIVDTPVPGLDLLPCSGDMEAIESDLAAMAVGQEFVLQDALELVANVYDYCIIDTPPAGMRTKVNVYVAADDLIITTIPDDYAIYGLSVLLRRLKGIQRAANPSLNILGCLVTLVERNNNKQVNLAALRAQEKVPVFQTTIRKNTDIATAITGHQPVTVFNPSSNGAVDYNAFVDELLPMINPRE